MTLPNNPRRSNGHRRNQLIRRLRAEGRPCWICQAMGKSGVIDYSLRFPHPFSFEADELVPVSKWREGGYESPEACALDYKNLAATHRCCNEWRSNKAVDEVMRIARDVRAGKDVKEPRRIVGDVTPTRDWAKFKPKGR